MSQMPRQQLTLKEKYEAKEYKAYVKLWNKEGYIIAPMMSLDEFLEERAILDRKFREAHIDWLERQKKYA